MGKYLHGHPSLFRDAPIDKDVVYTPAGLASHVVRHFAPTGRCLDPCRGDGAFHSLMPGSEWCELTEGRDFFLQDGPFDWCIGNPPYSCLLAWLRHSFKIARNSVYLMPLHRVFASYEFLQELNEWGGVKEIVVYGTGAHAGFPFGHALAAIHYVAGHKAGTVWTFPSKDEWT